MFTRKHINAEEKILRFISEYKSLNNGVSPSIREIGLAIGLTSTSHVWFYIHRLIDYGCILMKEHQPRTIQLTGKQWENRNTGSNA